MSKGPVYKTLDRLWQIIIKRMKQKTLSREVPKQRECTNCIYFFRRTAEEPCKSCEPDPSHPNWSLETDKIILEGILDIMALYDESKEEATTVPVPDDIRHTNRAGGQG